MRFLGRPHGLRRPDDPRRTREPSAIAQFDPSALPRRGAVEGVEGGGIARVSVMRGSAVRRNQGVATRDDGGTLVIATYGESDRVLVRRREPGEGLEDAGARG